RPGSFEAALSVPTVRTDLHVLSALADAMDVHLGLPDVGSVRRELTELSAGSRVRGQRAQEAGAQEAGAQTPAAQPAADELATGQARLATWHNLLDAGRLQDGEPNLAGTARTAVARMSAATAAEAGTADGGKVTVAAGRGSITLPVEIADMPDRVVWLPTNSAQSAVRRELAAGHGGLVTIRSAE
ncbi:MAG: NADH-quinone oxidoreductase subunit G, partial [Actinobacteria bacterium]|nr:NADH-quinone oxidoreductase subunit G [Actinomycetota bacterium]